MPALLLLGLAAGVVYPHDGTNTQAPGGGGSCSYEYTDHGGSPVVESASCHISTSDLNTGTEPDDADRTYVRALGGHDGCSNDDAGHILANRLGGKALPTNLFPQSPHLNRGAWKEFETTIAECLDGGGASSATLSWTFSYTNADARRPSTATYAASYNAGCSASKQSFANTCAAGPSPGPSPSPPGPSPSGGCCYYSDATCHAGQMCCSTSGKSYESSGTCSRYGKKHGCVFSGSKCKIPSSWWEGRWLPW